MHFRFYPQVRSNTERIARVTHHDSRCVASSIATTLAVGELSLSSPRLAALLILSRLAALLLQGRPCSTEEECEAIVKAS